VIRAANHRFADVSRPIMRQGHDYGEIVIEDDVWIGANCVITPNVRIGRGAVVGAGAVVKGLRAMTDFEYELQQADLNYRLDPGVESIFVMSSPEYGYLSSSVVRQIASFGGDVSEFVPDNVVKALKERFKC